MNVKTIKKAERRIESIELSNLSIQSYGSNNLYPQEISALVASSESASTCLDRYLSFIEGNGFRDINFSKAIINPSDQTCDDLLQQVSSDVGSYKGLALHVNYNVMCEIVSVHHVPFENCRLGEADDTGYISKIAVHPDWTGKLKRNGKVLKVSAENIDYIDIYNPDKNVIASQIEKAGDITLYKGQILWVSAAGLDTYPIPIHDSVVSQMSTEEGLGNIANRNTRYNFQPAGMVTTKKGQNTANEEGAPSDNSIAEAIGSVQGDLNVGKLLHFEIEFDEDKPEFTNFQGNNYDKDFNVTTETAGQKIYGAFNQEIWYRIMNGSIGFSSDILRDAYEYYSNVTNKERRMIERAFEKVFGKWGGINVSGDYSIKELTYISSITDSNILTTLYDKDMIKLNEVLISMGLPEKEGGDKYSSELQSIPLAVRLGVGGTQSLQSILIDPALTNEAKVGSLEILFGISNEDAKRLVYGTPN